MTKDIIMIAIGIAIAVFLSRTGIIDSLVSYFKDYYIFASFFAGIFFTSAFTLAPAGIALAHIAQNSPIHGVALWGGLGAMCGDLLLFFFIRDRFTTDLMKSMKPSTVKYIMHSFHFGFMRWVSPALGALIIASPLPDELGITLMGMSRVKIAVLMPIAFVMNVLGIYLLIAFANLL